MVGFLNNAIFVAASAGTVDFVVSAAATGYQTPAAAGAVDATTYRYRAQSVDRSEWEIGSAVASATGTGFTRVVIASSAGGTTKVNFTRPPFVHITMLASDFLATTGAQTLAGSLAINPAAASIDRGISITQTGPTSGSFAGPVAFNQIDATFHATVTGSSNPYFDHGVWQTECCAFRVNFTADGANLNGESFNAGFFHTRVEANTNPAGDGDFIGCLGMVSSTNAADANGAFHGLVGYVELDTGASVRVINGMFAEVDIVNGGLTTARRGLHIVSQGTGTATGSDDHALSVAGSANSGAFKHFLNFNTTGGASQPVKSTGDFVHADGAMTFANMFNCSNMTITGSIFNFPNFTVSGAGALNAGGGTADDNTGAMVNASIASGGVAALLAQANGASGFNGLHAYNSARLTSIYALVFEPSDTSTGFGQTRANWVELLASGSNNNGLLVGTSGAKPFIMGVSNAEKARIDGSTGFFNIGPAVTPDALLTVNANTGATPAPLSGTVMHLIGADGAQSRLWQESYGAIPIYNTVRTNGTRASKTAITSGNNLFTLAILGWNGSAQAAAGQLSFFAKENWSVSANGGSWSIYTTPLTTTTVTESTCFQPSGGVSVGATAIGTDPGAGNLSVSNALQVGSFTVAGLPSGVTGRTVYCSNCRVFNGFGTQEGAGAGTGGFVTYNGSAWKVAGTNATAVA